MRYAPFERHVTQPSYLKLTVQIDLIECSSLTRSRQQWSSTHIKKCQTSNKCIKCARPLVCRHPFLCGTRAPTEGA